MTTRSLTFASLKLLSNNLKPLLHLLILLLFSFKLFLKISGLALNDLIQCLHPSLFGLGCLGEQFERPIHGEEDKRVLPGAFFVVGQFNAIILHNFDEVSERYDLVRR